MKTLLILSIILLAGCSGQSPESVEQPAQKLAHIREFVGHGSWSDYYTHPDSIEILGGGYCVRFRDVDGGKYLLCGEYAIGYPE